MGRYTEQAKLAAVQEYCAGKAGLRDVAHRHDVDFSCLRQWVAAYQIHGVAGLQEKKRQRYSDEFWHAEVRVFYLNKFNNLDELHAGIDEYIEYYNQSRIKLKLNGLSPVEFRMQAAQAA
ncbi:Transposase [Pseudomonas syringae pv. syringae HS191]|nr:Transposase [Pseudomonas syringae pv. syringae HS191]